MKNKQSVNQRSNGISNINGKSTVIEIEPGVYKANSGGVVIGSIGFTSDNPVAKSVGWAHGQTEGISLTATGGNNIYHFTTENSKLQWSYSSMPNSFTMPVKNGETWSVIAQFASSNELDPPIHFYWLPNETNLEQTYSQLESDQSALSIPGIATFIGTSDVDKSEQHNIDKLMKVLNEVFGNNLSKTLELRLRDAVKDLVFQEIHKPG